MAPEFGGGLVGSFHTTGRVHLCPFADVSYVNGPTIGSIQTMSFGTTLGGQIGIVAFEKTGLQIVPTVGAAVQFIHLTATPAAGDSIVADDHSGLAMIGLGLIINEQLAITPTIAVPFALVGGETRFGVALTYNFALTR